MALLPYALLAVVSCGLLSVVAYDVGAHGLHTLSTGLLPAAIAIALVVLGTGLALASFRGQLLATRRLAEHVARLRLPLPTALAQSAGPLADRIDYLDADEAFSFAYGTNRPRVAISRGLIEGLDQRQLEAVLAHESYHVRNLDPLKIVVARVLSTAYFFLPALGGLRARYAAACELAADRRAIHKFGKAALAAALYHVVRGPEWAELTTAAAIGGPDFVDLRVAQLEADSEPRLEGVPRGAMVTTLVVLGVLATIIIATLVIIGPRAMRSDTSMMDGDMGGMSMGAGWLGWLLLVAVVCVAVWRMTRRRRVDTTRL